MISLVLSLILTKDKCKLKPLPLVPKCSHAFRVLLFFSDHQSFPTVMWIQIRVLSGRARGVRPLLSGAGQSSCSCDLSWAARQGPGPQATSYTHSQLASAVLLWTTYSSLALHISPSLPHRHLASGLPPTEQSAPHPLFF